MSNQGRTSRSRWWMFGVAMVACWIIADRLAGAPAEAAGANTLPREVLAVRRAVRQKMTRKTDDPLLKRMQRECVGTDVLAFQLPLRMRPMVVRRSGEAIWRGSGQVAHRVGQVPVVVVFGRASDNRQPAIGGQLFVVATCDPKCPRRTRICLMFTTPRPPAERMAS